LHVEKKFRNPLNAEKSPRVTEKFDYGIPAVKAEPERWVYPENDWGLMAKFRSQKQIYDDIYSKEKEYQHQVDSVAAIREENQRIIQAEFDRQKDLYNAAKKKKEEADQKRFNSIMNVDGTDSSRASAHNSVSCVRNLFCIWFNRFLKIPMLMCTCVLLLVFIPKVYIVHSFHIVC
jgi:hypothetical protein